MKTVCPFMNSVGVQISSILTLSILQSVLTVLTATSLPEYNPAHYWPAFYHFTLASGHNMFHLNRVNLKRCQRSHWLFLAPLCCFTFSIPCPGCIPQPITFQKSTQSSWLGICFKTIYTVNCHFSYGHLHHVQWITFSVSRLNLKNVWSKKTGCIPPFKTEF